ncbi:uncharacterized protein LOC124114003 [Haliotis rufescens]|uniref:uncharacterized protein LOC124114003 n=1 Tax=Haliotis rufescens TaxID=6454 RepID=UPI00201ED24A|nr:uncharacterized protein LOC124114003 [Haliotis rufescens]
MTGIPSEYVTLAHINKGVYPGVKNKKCVGVDDAMTGVKVGVTEFSKVKVNVETMTVIQIDFLFASSTGYLNPYGVAQDCYTRHTDHVRNACGPKGTFRIDTRGTGLLINTNRGPMQVLSTTVNKGSVIYRSR